ncbi:MAG: GNAT family N-acetyltransferase [Candidatus Krumholzibacteria bacterium]|nr:GNAT family N-acetyltransferase [Candidatus Krumholzibacteria bacterium]MDH4335790.1 GNAT family N-acetyltransferase [Candidatus Krumholzibacteria bacterium]MDH5269316.1 GNAT family N-acetyltransferase [Candidatus Krumholzibacteria bacterium]MDH5628037.1 GNAT family N-acetyltransferase [Candidatus Krumholzibacteria bacterium]
MPRDELRFYWATASRWNDVEVLFGERGACGGCWCMTWRLTRTAFMAGKKTANRRALKKLVEGGNRPGIIACHGREPVAWCAVAPRAEYSYLSRSRVLAPVDDAAVWSISCFFVAKPWRRRGVSVRLLRAAAEMAFKRGARVVEGYPQQSTMTSPPDAFVWTGLPSTFVKAGFSEVARRSPTRPIFRRTP